MEFSIRFLFLAAVTCYLSVINSTYGKLCQSGLSASLSLSSMTGSIWPRPFSHPYETKNISVATSNFTIEVMNATTKEKIDCDFLRYATKHYETLIRNLKTVNNPVQEAELNFPAKKDGESRIVVYLDKCTEEYPLVFDPRYESYTIKMNKSTPSAPRGLRMFAGSSHGVLRGLESFYQMLWKAPSDSGGQNLGYQLNETIITDHPRFGHRPFKLDTSRHYLPERVILKILTGMMYNKLNVFHWHRNAVYSPEMVQRIVEAASLRGIQTLLELNTPNHADSIENSHPSGRTNYMLLIFLGGKSAVGAEYNVNSMNIVPRIFPFVGIETMSSGSALWDSKIDTVEGRERTEEAMARLNVFRCSLVRRGIAAQPIYPDCRYVMCLRPMHI